ncbi:MULTISPECIES: sugar ABC transporter substrate-binding protein [unclassified Paenibacillus]|uniref:ABC transporter substrate-binding protein n=1 Tax=unclassified Paenibacillus TaxID=185978 RepID=UPI00020D6A84|nr:MULTISPECIES: sugar ABC transporter substrate-binding protein [unclassified Paenibacillus]EGL15351.1 ABC transporter, solute-binding protein [Paenibacillus sp. HGF7]EPD89639.1 hypothetical protein HMPREF1207_01488 [Paenibacillus sp. HGH0039]
MRRKTGWKAIVPLTALTAVIAAGCSQEAESKVQSGKAGASSQAPITLNLAVWDEKLKDTLNQTIEIYKKTHSNVNVQITITPNKDYWTKMQTSLVGGAGPDILMMNGPNFYKFAALGLLTDLQPYIEKDKLDTAVFPEGITELYKYNKHSYGIPYYLGSLGLFYNKELFDQAKIPYPDETWDWEKLKANAAKLTDKEKKTYGYIAVNADQVGYYPLIYQAGGSVVSEDRTKSGLDLPETRKALEFMKSLMDEGISPSAQQQLDTEALQIFGSGKAAMYPGGSFDAYNLNRMLGGKLGVAPLPKGAKQGFYVHGSSWVINNKTKHPQETWDLLKVLAGKEGSGLLAKNGINFPAYTENVDLWAKSIPALDMNAFVSSLNHTAPYPVSKNTAEWQKALTEEVTGAFLGKKSVQEALQAAAQKMNGILANEQNQ